MHTLLPFARASRSPYRLYAPVHSSQPLKTLYSPLGSAPVRATSDLLEGSRAKVPLDGQKDGRMRYEYCFFGLFCAFVLNVQNTLSETFLLARVRVTKLCGLGR